MSNCLFGYHSREQGYIGSCQLSLSVSRRVSLVAYVSTHIFHLDRLGCAFSCLSFAREVGSATLALHSSQSEVVDAHTIVFSQRRVIV
jgi:hypothetical protein